ncbi:MAG TPA: hypothetical protein VFG54_09045 [Prolixibacteraceae bacterium]|nr:hypothetical protein [Prolixibacteraceae bacterium]
MSNLFTPLSKALTIYGLLKKDESQMLWKQRQRHEKLISIQSVNLSILSAKADKQSLSPTGLQIITISTGFTLDKGQGKEGSHRYSRLILNTNKVPYIHPWYHSVHYLVVRELLV